MSYENTTLSSSARSLVSAPAVAATSAAYWTLRIGAALCFIGHGAFGFITKAAWLPYFGVVGIPESWAWKMMPLVGTVDILAGMAVLFAPRGLPLVYMTVWALWTALLRPLSGESFFETLERAGNYGVPFALILLTGARTSIRSLLIPLTDAVEDERALSRAKLALRWSTCLLLIGHGAIGVFTESTLLSSHYASIGLPANARAAVGLFELALAATVALRPAAGVLVFIAAWKLATEMLFISAGAPLWEVVERAGSYAAPLALAVLLSEKVRKSEAYRI
jgi:hypothetical protein